MTKSPHVTQHTVLPHYNMNAEHVIPHFSNEYTNSESSTTITKTYVFHTKLKVSHYNAVQHLAVDYVCASL